MAKTTRKRTTSKPTEKPKAKEATLEDLIAMAGKLTPEQRKVAMEVLERQINEVAAKLRAVEIKNNRLVGVEFDRTAIDAVREIATATRIGLSSLEKLAGLFVNHRHTGPMISVGAAKDVAVRDLTVYENDGLEVPVSKRGEWHHAMSMTPGDCVGHSTPGVSVGKQWRPTG